MKKNMIRIAGLAVSLFLILGCSGGGGSPLRIEDFAIYEEGECIALMEEVVEADEYGCRLFNYSREGEALFSNRILETNRGIKIGSTVRELTERYGGLLLGYFGPEDEDDGQQRNEVLLIDDFLKHISDYDTSEYTLMMSGWMIDGRLVNGFEYEFMGRMDEDISTDNEEHEFSVDLFFLLKNNVVEDISIMRIDR